MERLGIYIFYFFFFGICFFERVRTNGETGSLWQVLFRNLAVLIFAVSGFFFFGIDLMFPTAAHEAELFKTAKSILSYNDPNGDSFIPGARFTKFMQIWLDCLFCATATLIVSSGIWELKISRWNKWILIAMFSLLVYPVFGKAAGGFGFLGRMHFYDHANALLVWVLPAIYVLGARLSVPASVLPNERKHDLKGVKILPGMKQRFFMSRGIGFTMIFLILSATTLVNLPIHSNNTKMLWVMSKTLTLIPASLTMIFCNFLFFGLFGRNKIERISYAPPFFAVMTALVATQACNQYGFQQAVVAAAAATFTGLLYLRTAPLKVRIWDPICSVPLFLIGGIMGVLLSSLTEVSDIKTQAVAVVVCLIFGGGVGALLTTALRRYKALDPVTTNIVTTEESEPKAIERSDPAPTIKKKKFFGRKS